MNRDKSRMHKITTLNERPEGKGYEQNRTREERAQRKINKDNKHKKGHKRDDNKGED